MSMQKEGCFDDKTHQYFYRGFPFKSVTQRISLFEKKADFTQIAEDVSHNPMSQYFQREAHDILAEWKDKGIAAGTKGKVIHKIAECLAIGADADARELAKDKYFEYYESLARFFSTSKVDVVFPEVIVFGDKAQVAGTIDLITYNGDGSVDIWDWKTSEKELKIFGDGTFFEKPLNFVPCNKYWSYSLQLQAYRYILQSIGISVRNATLVHLREKNYEILVTKTMEQEAADLLYYDEFRKINKNI